MTKISIYLTTPVLEDIKATLSQQVIGKFIFNKLLLNYNFTDAFNELEIEPKFPFKLKLNAFFFTNKHQSESKAVEITVWGYI